MVDVDNMSDAELRAKLTEFGFPVMPITGTTRKTMAKKLKMLMENKNKISKEKDRQSLGRYSSEEESDSDVRSSRRDRYKRQTMAAPPMQPPPPRRRTTTKLEETIEDVSPVRKEIKTTTSTTRTMKILQSAQDEFDTGSESDEVAEKYNSNSTSYSESFKRTPPSNTSRLSSLPSSYVSASAAADAASEKLSQIRSRYSQYSSHYNSDDFLKEKETPFLSNFTKRLSQLSESSPPTKSYDYKSDIIKENDVNGGTNARSYLNNYRATRGRPSTYDYKLSNQNILKNNLVPFIVLGLAILFFIIVGIVYMGIRSDSSLEVIANVPICVKADPNSRRYVNCILENEKRATLNLLEVLKPELDKRAVKNKCEDGTSKPYMTETDVVGFVVANFAIKDQGRIIADLNNLEVLSFLNPIWGIGVLQLPEDGVGYSDDAVVLSMDDVNEGKPAKVTALISRHPYVPWKCYFYNTIWAFVSLLTSLIGGVMILFVLNYVFKSYKQMRQKRQEEEMSIVENIIDILQTNAADNEENYMVINHVRDMIIPINERKKKQSLWSRAVKYIHENESRIRTEERVVQGEVAEVWRWLGGPSSGASKNKSWQGQAFETQVGSVNSLPCSPTPCLKIRGMVEEGDRNTLLIKKAVLGKCENQCRILHCAVDLNSKCVYLHCADPSDAAVAYRNLHGWWYAGNLVTVKYLRLERYMQRFPDSPVSGPPYLQQ